jgi:hypothetical protein
VVVLVTLYYKSATALQTVAYEVADLAEGERVLMRLRAWWRLWESFAVISYCGGQKQAMLPRRAILRADIITEEEAAKLPS